MEVHAENLTELSISMPDGAALHSDVGAAGLETGQDHEARLLAAAKGGDTGALGELFNRYRSRIFYQAQRIVRNHEDAEDVVQEAFHLAFVHLQAFKGGARFSTWLSRIAINVALMKLRKKSRKVEISIDQSQSGENSFQTTIKDTGHDPEQSCMLREQSRILREALARLSPNARRVLELHEMEGLAMKEIADDLGISEAAVKARLFHARPKMRHQLNRYFIQKRKRPNALRFGTANPWNSGSRSAGA
jgi:RNA polymerase sigma-70 factor (ECF subfamily)